VNFSSRISWSLEPNLLTRQIQKTPPHFDLTQSNPTDAGIEYPTDRIVEAFADARALHYDPTPLGLLSAREAVSAYYDGGVSPERLLLTASTSEAYAYLFKLLCDPGDEVLVPRPSYPLFDILAQLESVRVKHYPMHHHDGWYIDTAALRQAITPRTRAIVFVNPNNPTGSFLKQEEYAELASHGLPLIVDEVFSDYAFQPDARRVPSTALRHEALTFTLSGLSKVAGLPQVKLGWMAVSGPPQLADAAFERLEMIADTFLSVGSPVQYAAPALLGMRYDIQRQILARTCRNINFLRQAIRNTALRVLDVEAGWYATVQVPRIRTEEEWVLYLLEKNGVLVQPGYFYDFESEAYLVLSLLTAPDVFEPGVEALIAAAP
jgi:aspartate/methionine/tyrosine aminotransferase